VEPEIICADEPTGNLDQKTEKEILEVFEKIHKDLKKTFILVTHEPDLIRLSDSSYELREGKLFEIK
jgi:putative ABC transport system ATP-binding protein